MLNSLQVPAYADFIKERFERCLDLYLCPRTRRKRLFVPDAKALVPKLPKPSDLRPFPITLALRYLGHKAAVSCSQIYSMPLPRRMDGCNWQNCSLFLLKSLLSMRSDLQALQTFRDAYCFL